MRIVTKGAVRVLTLIVATAAIAADAPKQAIRGEIVDSYCYTVPSIRGKAHMACAIRCMRKGVPPVFIESNPRRTVYVLQAPTDATPLPGALIDLAGQEIVIEGEVVTKGGTNFLTVRSFRATR